jgi:2-(1,2-epoxy-1,2-dihydrophenyl)acetyl-CoA isomerase
LHGKEIKHMTDPLLISRNGPVLTLSLNRPARRNALTIELTHALAKALEGADRDPAVRAVILTGEGGHFCSGIDLMAAMEGTDPSVEGRGELVQRTLVGGLHPALLALWSCRKPTLGLLPGATVGFGLSLALACDLRLLATDSYFTTQFAARGLFPDGALLYQLERLCGLGRALELSLRPELRLSAAEAVGLGLASRAVPPGDLTRTGLALAEELARGAPLVQAAIKRVARRDELGKVLAEEVSPVLTCLKSHDAMEGLMAFMEKRPTVFRGE